MDTKPIRELSDVARAVVASDGRAAFITLGEKIAAAEAALAAEPGQVYGSETPASHYLPNQDDALRLADKFSATIAVIPHSPGLVTIMASRLIIELVDQAREYRKARGLEESNG